MSRRQRREAQALALLAVLTAVVFMLTPADIIAARVFYRPLTSDHWPIGSRLPWSVLYRLAPSVTASLVLGALAWLICGVLRSRQMWRRYAVFTLLSVVIGPGLLANAVFKDHWERPRPRDIVQFDGVMSYVPAPLRGAGGGSFPCGHCSVGFLYGLGFWIWRHRRPRLARVSLAAGIIAGGALGIGRMAAGAHFLSDVIWSALLAFGVAHALYYYALRIPEHEALDSQSPATTQGRILLWSTVIATLGAAGVLAALFAGPHGSLISQNYCPMTPTQSARELVITARVADIEIVLTDTATSAPPGCISVSGELHGFGLPSSRLTSGFRFNPARAQLDYRIEQQGWFTDLSGTAVIQVPVGELERIAVRLDRGNIQVMDLTRSAVVRNGLLRLDLHTRAGLCNPPGACAAAGS